MNAVNPILDQPKDKEALTLLFMSLETRMNRAAGCLQAAVGSFAMTALPKGWRRT